MAVRGAAVPSRSQEHLYGEQPDLETCSLELLCYRGDGYSSQRKSLPFLGGYGCCAVTHRTSVSGVHSPVAPALPQEFCGLFHRDIGGCQPFLQGTMNKFVLPVTAPTGPSVSLPSQVGEAGVGV